MYPILEYPLLVQAAIAMIFGLIVGSFLNVVIYRVPRGESVVLPASHCGSCGAAVKPYDNIPVLSYLILGGKCRFCKASFSWVYPAVEFLTGCLFFAVVWQDGITGLALLEVIFAAVTVALIFIDYRHQLLPNVITYPAFFVVMIFAALQITPLPLTGNSFIFSWSVGTKPWLGGALLLLCAGAFYAVDAIDNLLFSKYMEMTEEEEEADELSDVDEEKLLRQHNRIVYPTMILGGLLALGWTIYAYLKAQPEHGDPIWVTYSCEAIYHACLGALVGGFVIWFFRAFYFYVRGFGGMGLGDVKMMAIIGALLGWQAVLLVLILASLTGSLAGVAQLAFSKNSKGMKAKLPFGVFLGIGALVALFYGQQLVQAYLSNLR